MSEIVSIGKLSDARIAELAEQGIEVKDTFDLDELNLPEPAHGEMFCFHAEPDETAIFIELHEISIKIDKWERKLLGAVVTDLGGKITKSDLSQPWQESINEDRLRPKFENDEEEENFYRLRQRRDFLKVFLCWKIGERGNVHSYRTGFRKPAHGEDTLRVVKVVRRLDYEFGQGHE